MRRVPAAQLVARGGNDAGGEEGTGVRVPPGVSVHTTCTPMLMLAGAGAQEKGRPLHRSLHLPLAHGAHPRQPMLPAPHRAPTAWQDPGEQELKRDGQVEGHCTRPCPDHVSSEGPWARGCC